MLVEGVDPEEAADLTKDLKSHGIYSRYVQKHARMIIETVKEKRELAMDIVKDFDLTIVEREK